MGDCSSHDGVLHVFCKVIGLDFELYNIVDLMGDDKKEGGVDVLTNLSPLNNAFDLPCMTISIDDFFLLLFCYLFST